MIETIDLTKRFKDVTAVDRITFTAHDGEIFGLLGPNGAGKTTTMRMLATLLAPDGGRALVAGHDTRHDPQAVRANLGILLEDAGLYDRLDPREHLRYYGELRGIPRAALEERIETVIRDLDITPYARRRAEGFSYGMRRRVILAEALLHDPANLLLDEPTAGLDVMSARTVRNLIARYRASGRCVIVSTHNMSEAQRLCDRIGIIYKGRVHALGTPAELCAQAGVADLEEAFVYLLGEDLLRAHENAGEPRAAQGWRAWLARARRRFVRKERP
jgi:sodium transport system ATP-binding protein